MTNVSPVQYNAGVNAAFLLNSKPTTPLPTKASFTENKTSDPSAVLPKEDRTPFQFRLSTGQNQVSKNLHDQVVRKGNI